jgi:CheY-like chemotaxis protein
MPLILIVEDDASNAKLLQNMLQLKKYDTLVAIDGTDALAMMLKHQPDLVLLDLRLPGEIKGWDVVQRARQNPAIGHIPFIAMTAYDSQHTKRKIVEVGCQGYLPKPFTLQGLQAHMESLLRTAH